MTEHDARSPEDDDAWTAIVRNSRTLVFASPNANGRFALDFPTSADSIFIPSNPPRNAFLFFSQGENFELTYLFLFHNQRRENPQP